MQHVLISANKGVVSLFSLYCLRVPREERGVGFLRRFCPVAGRMAFWETWVGRWRSGEQHRVTRCFLHRCLLFVYLQNERHGHLSLSLSPFFSHLSSSLLVLPTALSSVFVFLPLFSKLTCLWSCCRTLFIGKKNTKILNFVVICLWVKTVSKKMFCYLMWKKRKKGWYITTWTIQNWS